MSLTEAHFALLRAAAQRDDLLLRRPDKLIGAALYRMAARLIAFGVTETVPVDPGEFRWLRDGAEASGLRMTPSGRDAVAAEPAACFGALSGPLAAGPVLDDRSDTIEPALSQAPRRATKRARLIGLLARNDGATLDDLVTALAWQPHTVRAALTRLRQGGMPVDRITTGGGPSRYRLSVVEDGPGWSANGVEA